MSQTLMDQLLAAGFAPNAEPSARTQPARPQIVKKRTRGSGQGLPPSQLFWQLPRWGTVASWEDNRGFGFIQYGGSKTLFFHVKAEIVGVSSAHQRMRVGEPVVFIIGEDPRKPGDLRAVRWARVSGCHWDGVPPPSSQTSLDKLRSNALVSLPMETLWTMLQADWYAHQWPVDNEMCKLADPLLIHAWCSKASSVSVQELTDDPMRILLMQKCYDFWDALSMGYVLQTLAPQQLASVFGSPGAWMPSASAQHRSKLVQWYLLRTKGRIGDDWKQWFSGRDAREAEAAGFWLDQGLTPTGDIRQWIQQLIIRKLLPPDRVEQWVQDDSNQAVQLFEYLPEPLQKRFLANWHQHPYELETVLNTVNPGRIEPFFLQGVLPLGLEARAILTLYPPNSAWMRSVSAQHRSKLMQWHLLHTKGRIGDDWKQWFSGRDAHEAEAAGLWLDQGLAPTDDIRQWMQQLILRKLLPPDRVEQWFQDDSTEAVQLFEYFRTYAKPIETVGFLSS